MINMPSVDRKQYHRRWKRNRKDKIRGVVHSIRTGPYTPTEDSIVSRDDLLTIEKMAILQRSELSILYRARWLAREFSLQCPVCNDFFVPKSLSQKFCSAACSSSGRIIHFAQPCLHCGKIFKPNSHNRRFCSHKCSTDANIRNPSRPCPVCEIEFKPGSKKQTCCSRICAKAWWAAKFDREKALRLLDHRDEHPCPTCKVSFVPSSFWQKFCSRECGYESQRYLFPRKCSVCKTQFKPKSSSQKTCCFKCGIDSRRKVETRDCVNCKKQFKPKAQKTKYCSHKCSTDAQIRNPSRPCPVCEIEFKPRVKNQKCCSRNCGSALRKTRGDVNKARQNQRALDSLLCAVCGIKFKPRKSTQPQKNCSRECRTIERRSLMTEFCSFPNCGRKHCAKGFCNSHYSQQLRGIELRPIGGNA